MVNLNISNVGQMIKEAEKKWLHYCDVNGVKDPVVIVNNSGGKDSGATDLLAKAILGDDGYRSVACDTDNENPLTIEHLKSWHLQRGGRPVEIIKKEYSENLFEKRKAKVNKQWKSNMIVRAGAYKGIVMPSLGNPNTKFAELWRVNAKRVGWGDKYGCALDAFNDTFKKTGNAFLDMCMLHGGIPLGRQRFCTDELKIDTAFELVIQPLLDEGEEVVTWSGVRAQESEKRASYNEFEADERGDGYLWNFMPVHKWVHQDVFAIHKYFGVKPNPLYTMGMERVGCMPCILVSKQELSEIALRFPEEIDRIREWELEIGKLNRWLHWMINGHVNRRQFKGMVNSYRVISEFLYGEQIMKEIPISKTFKFGDKVWFPKHYKLDVELYKGSNFLGPRGGEIGGGVDSAVDWSRTGRGGKTYDLVTAVANKDLCSSKYGLCG